MTRIDQRDRILRSLIEGDPHAPSQVLDSGDAGTYLLTPRGEPLQVIAAPEPNSEPELLGARVREILGKFKGAVLHLLVVGGGEREQKILKAQSPRFQLSRRLHVHHIDDTGAYQAVTRGKLLDVIEDAAAQARIRGDSLLPISPDEMRAAIARGASLMAEQQRFGDTLKQGGQRVTMFIAGSLAVLFLLEIWFGGGDAAQALYAMGANFGKAVIAGQPWRLLASAFLHGGVAHAAINTISLLSIAPLFEGLLGPRRFSVLYLLCALGGSIVSATVHPETVSIGASGAIWGLLGATAGLVAFPRGRLPSMMLAQMKQRIWLPLLINFVFSLQPGIDMACHLGGGVVGFLLIASDAVTAGLPSISSTGSSSGPQVEKHSGVFLMGAVVLWALALASIASAFVVGRPWELQYPPSLVRTKSPAAPIALLLPPNLVESVAADPRP